TFSSTFPAVAYSITSLSPDDFSKAGVSCCSTARIAPEHTTLISAAQTALAESPVNSARTTANSPGAIFGISAPRLELIVRVEKSPVAMSARGYGTSQGEAARGRYPSRVTGLDPRRVAPSPVDRLA